MEVDVDHLEVMRGKLAQLRDLGAVEEMERRWEEEYGDEYDTEMLAFYDPVALAGQYPEGLAALYQESDCPTFGDISFRRESNFSEVQPVGSDGEPIDDRRWLQIADIDEEAVLLDLDSGSVMVYWFTYFKYGWDTGVVLECDSLAAFVNTVALGPRFVEIYGPREKLQTPPWWEGHPWYEYLQEIGMITIATEGT
jgi:hypothetical protein